MESAFNPKTGDWELAWPERITQYDLVYLSPPLDPMQGIPLGNGDIGNLLWCEGSRIVVVLNKSDLWDDARFGRFHNWISAEEDKSTALRHAGRLIIDFGVPLLDPFYLKDFEARLDLASAQAQIYATTPFGQLNFSAYVSATENALVINCEINTSEKVSHNVILERWGSRTFAHWYAKVRRDPTIGLAGTDAAVRKDELMLTHRLTSGKFAVGCKVIPRGGIKLVPKRLHSRSICCEISSHSLKKEWSLVLTVTSPLKKGSAARAARKVLAGVCGKGAERLFAEHQDFWKDFWNRSYINISNDYLENLWHLTMYYGASSQRGKSPATFVNALWGWNRDVHPWSFYFHWNQQMIYWPLLAAGHSELLLSYLNYRFESLSHAMEDARDWFGVDGAFISDVAERRGYNDVHKVSNDNHTPVAQIAMDFWRYYRFTGDKYFLQEKGFPFMRKAAQFFESLFEKRADGLYHAKRGTVYEGSGTRAEHAEDVVTELSMAKALFSAVLKAAEELKINPGEKARVWREIADNLAPFITVPAPPQVIREANGEFTLQVGAFRGSRVPSCELIAAGRKLSDGKILTSRVYSAGTDASEGVVVKEKIVQSKMWNNIIPLVLTPLAAVFRYPLMVLAGDVFPGAELCPVWPAEVCNLSDKDTPLFKSLAATVKAHSPEYSGWEPTPIVLARLGLAEEALALLEERPDKWQIYCNGFWRANSEEVSKAESLFFFGVNRVADAVPESDGVMPDEKKFDCASWPYRHMECEPMGVLSCAINEMLIQSHEGVIRIAPAFKGDAEFSLHAIGGFVVSSEIKSSEVQWVAVKSLLGNHCKVENPWGTEEVCVIDNDSVKKFARSRVISFDMARGNTYILSKDPDIKKKWSVRRKIFKRNAGPKKSKGGVAMLGLPKMF